MDDRMTASVSIIVPCYGYGYVLHQCVQSILDQQGVEVEVLVIDDASPDDTPEVAASLMEQDSRVEYRRHLVNQGHIASFNEGLEWARCDYTLLISADDMLTPGALRRMTQVLDAHPDASFGYGRALVWRQGEQKPTPSGSDDAILYQIVHGRSWIERMCRNGDNLLYSPEVITRTSVQKVVGGYRSALSHTHDMEMWLRFAAHGDAVILDADQAIYRIHGENMHLGYKQSIVDLEQRRGAFLSALDEYGDRIAGVRRLRWIARRAVVQDEIRYACRVIDRGGGRSEAMTRLRWAIQVDPLCTITSRIFYSCLTRLAIGPTGFGRLREVQSALIRSFRNRLNG